ncbi:uncharacterized protein LOC110858792 [Folsomia candida]|uniref:Death domain-containing protein n=1 Tax=Folsomia candida TaxID=158441 RepID=A0A226DGN8_FOLCA|nr:uncharacterized protein LOC110858792 [Folsomia candida]OXA43356.1 hypothetical protein Fcan01_21899 [Folsomia candida]
MPKFDFEKFEVDASIVLREIWSLLQDRLTITEVSRLNAIFVSSNIFQPNELAVSKTSEGLLTLLHARSKKQKADAINIICAEPVHQEIREKVQTYFTKGDTQESEQPPTPDVDRLVAILMKDHALDWSLLGSHLGVNQREIDDLSTQRLTGVINSSQLFRKIILSWISTNGSKATVDSLCKILHDNKMIFCEERVAEEFGIKL